MSRVHIGVHSWSVQNNVLYFRQNKASSIGSIILIQWQIHLISAFLCHIFVSDFFFSKFKNSRYNVVHYDKLYEARMKSDIFNNVYVLPLRLRFYTNIKI